MFSHLAIYSSQEWFINKSISNLLTQFMVARIHVLLFLWARFYIPNVNADKLFLFSLVFCSSIPPYPKSYASVSTISQACGSGIFIHGKL